MVAPLLFVASAIIVISVRDYYTKKATTVKGLVKRLIPVVLRISFLTYPIITNVAFDAFSCFIFEDGRGWLIADVNIQCYTPEHRRATGLAVWAILLYPVGLFLLNAALLYSGRHAIRRERPSSLSKKLAFLHKSYQPRVFWWELRTLHTVPVCFSLWHVVLFVRVPLQVGADRDGLALPPRWALRRLPVQAGLDHAGGYRGSHLRDLPCYLHSNNAVPRCVRQLSRSG